MPTNRFSIHIHCIYKPRDQPVIGGLIDDRATLLAILSIYVDAAARQLLVKKKKKGGSDHTIWTNNL